MLLFSFEITYYTIAHRTGLTVEEIGGYIGALDTLYSMFPDRGLEWFAAHIKTNNMAEGLGLVNALIILDGVPNSVYSGENLTANDIKANLEVFGNQTLFVNILKI